MAYSGTIGTTVIDVQTLIDHGARRCGKLAEELTSRIELEDRLILAMVGGDFPIPKAPSAR